MDLDSLYLLVTDAILRAEALDDLGAPGAPDAYLDLSLIEERIALKLPASTPEGALARRGAVRAAVKAGDPLRAARLVESFSEEPDVTAELGAAVRDIAPGHPQRPPTSVPSRSTDHSGFVPIGVAIRPGSDAAVSSNGRYRLTLQTDGDLVLYDSQSGERLWHTKTVGPGVHHAILESDGNLVIYDASGAAIWESNTESPPNYAAVLRLQDDGNLVMYQYARVAIWATDTAT
ncbi:MAG: hypothetical protein ACRD12_17755 [Acidimicrobiales bacterium]